jgi:uncharacterized protein (DUF305 family)
MNRTVMGRVLAAGALATMTMAFAAACGGSGGAGNAAASAPAPTASTQPSGTPAGPVELNQADVAFAQMMLPHHQQAVQMASLAATRASDPDIKALAARFSAEAGPQITMMSGWLKAKGVPPMPAGAHDMPGMPNMGMPGMASDQEMAKLKAAKGIDFDRMFARLMIAHHNGAIQMCQNSRMQGVNGPVAQMADAIEQTQGAEVAQLQTILDRL